MAEVLWKDATRRLRRALPVVSVGLEARPGTLVDPVAMELLAERGIDLSDHRARRFEPVTAMRHHLVLVMEPEHQRRILAVAPALAGRVHLLGRWGPGPIEDPYGASRPVYEDCLARLERSVIAWLNRIVDGIDAHRHEQQM
jgi:protein-tyrosine phosphatase